MYCCGLVYVSTTLPGASRTSEGPRTGSSTNGPGVHAPVAERQTEILIVAIQARRGRRIEQTTYADRGIEHEASEIVGRGLEFALQRIIDHHRRRVQIREEIADARADGLGHDAHVGRATGLATARSSASLNL